VSVPLDPNRAMLLRVAQALGDLRESLVFVGGCATGLLVTTIRAQMLRPTDDVDMVAQAATAREYHKAEQQLQARGFVHDISADAPICRWRYRDIVVDLMPSEDGVLGFHNRWYPLAVQSAQTVMLDDGISICLIAAPVFVATKLEAFQGRGKSDFLMSHDPGRHHHGGGWARFAGAGSAAIPGGTARIPGIEFSRVARVVRFSRSARRAFAG
jgi:predicted nucleotidyltransferase